MIQSFLSRCRLAPSHLSRLSRSFCTDDLSRRIESAWKKGEWNSDMVDRAKKLMLGETPYEKFTDEQKAEVDFVQGKISEASCGCVFLPNTKEGLEWDSGGEDGSKN